MDRPPHILEDFELELQSLRGAVLSMATTAQNMIQALDCMFRDTAPDQVQTQDQERELDHSEVRVDEQARLILVKFQPMASDFREVTGALRISCDLEGVGDEVHRISTSYENLRPWLSHDADGRLQKLWKRSGVTLKTAIHAYSDHDVKLAEDTVAQKHQVREEAEEVLRGISSAVAKFSDLAPYFLDAVNTAAALERIGRIASNIAETVVYIETAKDVRHNLNP